LWLSGGNVKPARGANRTPAHLKKKDFLEALRATGLVTDACKIARIARRTPYDWAQKSEEFAEAMEAARAEGEMVLLDEVRKEARRRGIEGWDDPIVYQGKISKRKDPKTGEMVPLTVRRWSDNLLMFWGKYLDARFRDNFPAIDIRSSGPSSVSIVLDTTPKSSRPATDGESQPEAIDVTPDSTSEDS